jgi:DNA repair protein RadC
MKVSDLSITEQPLYRLSEYGGDKLSLAELLALIIGTDNSLEIATQMIFKFKTLEAIKEASPQELQSIKGIGKAQAGRLIASLEISKRFAFKFEQKRTNAVTSPDILYEQIKHKLTNFYKEHFFVCSLDTRNVLISIDEISVGTLTASLVHPRECFSIAIKRHAAHIIISHNHPSGNTDPSEDDLKITRRLVDAGKVMGIEVLDHLIVCEHRYLSFKEKFLI